MNISTWFQPQHRRRDVIRPAGLLRPGAGRLHQRLDAQRLARRADFPQKSRLQEALAAGLVDRIIEPAATEKTPAAQATPAGQWRKLLGKLGLVRPADALPPDRNILHFGDPEKGSGPRTSELALHEGQQFAAPTRTLPREDPSIGETTPSANQRAYAEDAKQLIR